MGARTETDTRNLTRLTVPGRRAILLTAKAKKRRENNRRSIQVGSTDEMPDHRMRFKDRLTI